ncbi:nucleotide exchange factor GrpE [Streptomyces halobius]|uniref:nucleotide exchange factor GrpE n=1 Tax=Streptomyces halobius TaxID=2879846 RepID=UPI0029E7CD10|nr:nucleotide exchange factor GrpE [Streptomyces halobius]
MNRSTDDRGGTRPQLVVVPGGAGNGPAGPDALPDRAAHGEERTGRAGGGSSGRDTTTPQPSSSHEAELREELRERTADLQRLKAEYDNYRKRIRRDRLAVRQIAVANVLDRLLPVLDALAEAREQGEVTGGFQRVAEVLETELAALGLEPLGTVGETFDPRVHEALSYAYAPADTRGPAPAAYARTGSGTPTETGTSAGTQTPTDRQTPTDPQPSADTRAAAGARAPAERSEPPACAEILRLGYRVGDHLLRPAQVTVAEAARPTTGTGRRD